MIDNFSDWLILAQETTEVVEAATKAAPEPATGPGGGTIALVLFLVFAVPLIFGGLIAQLLKLKDLSTKLSIVFFTAILGIMPFAWQVANGNSWTDAIKLGIDLAGGTNLVYQIDVLAARESGKLVNAELVDRMVGAIQRRLDPAGQEQITVRRVGADRIEVIIPGADPEVVKQKKNQMTRLGKLEFAILANRRRHQPIIDLALQSTDRDIRQGGRIVASWRPVAKKKDGTSKDVDARADTEVSRESQRDGQPVKELLVVLDPLQRRVTGKYLTRAAPTFDENGRRAVSFTFNTKGGHLFASLTGNYQPETDDFGHRLAVLLDDQIHSAPNLITVISDQGQITGDFTAEEVNELVNVLNAGALEAPLIPNPISEQSISPMLGADVQQKGMIAIAIAAISVVVFMLIYYMFAGVVANTCLLLNLVLVMGVMALIEATFTLPGLAGIVLTIGMAVDANVLIFERIREETQRGSSLRMSIQNGFGKALSTIVDANVTTLLTGIVLYMIGTDQVRGFAVTLIIGIVMSMYTALVFGRLIFDIVERKRWIKKLKMLTIVSKPQWNFLSKRMIAALFSIGLIIVGMGALFTRGEDNLDIDFTGGTMVTIQFVEEQKIGNVSSYLQEKMGTGITVEELKVEESAEGKLFRVRTKEQNMDTVRDQINTAFAAHNVELRRVTVEFGELSVIVAQADSAAGTAEKKDATEAAQTPKTSNEDESSYVGGNQIELSFFGSGSAAEIHLTTAEDYLVSELEKLKKENDEKKYEEVASLLSFQGTAGSGTEATEGQVRKYSQILLKASPNIDEADLKSSLAAMQQNMADYPIFEEVNTFASSIAGEMQQSALLAMFFSLVVIVAYIWFRFQRITFGFAAVVALVHDVLIVLGLVALASYASGSGVGNILLIKDFKINLPMIAAFLTIVGYSLNDTIVVFDRIREVRGKNPALTEEMVNTSLNQTLSRTILTSLTTFLVVGILYAVGGEGIHGFAFCLVMGVIVGTYSSIYVASPVLLWLMNRPGSETGMATSAVRK